MRKSLTIAAGLTLAMSLLVPATVLAFGAMDGNTNTVAQGRVHQGTLYAVGSAIDIAGEVKGDLICVGSNITVSGTVDGDVLCAGQNIDISGHVTGDVRVVGSLITINGTVDHNVNVAGSNLTVGDQASLGEDLAFMGNTETVNGQVARELYGAMSDIRLNSEVGNNVTLWPGTVSLGDAAKIDGDFSYTTTSALAIDQAKVGGKINFHAAPKVTKSPREEFAAWVANLVYWLVAVLLIALTMVWLAPRAVKAVTDSMRSRIGPSLGWGALALFVGPILVLALIITTIAAPLGLIALVAWILALCLCGSLAGVAVGRLLLAKLKWHAGSLPWAALIGVPIAMLAFALPVVGGLLALVTSIWAMGGVILAWRESR